LEPFDIAPPPPPPPPLPPDAPPVVVTVDPPVAPELPFALGPLPPPPPVYLAAPPLLPAPPEIEDVLLITYGNLVHNCISVKKLDPKISVLVINRLHPIDNENLIKLISGYQRLIVIEDHFPLLGLYGTLTELVARNRLAIKIESIAPKEYAFDVGVDSEYFHKKYKLDSDGIQNIIRQ
jgi:hypothetical protein